jgi:hypothetical protein
MEQHVEAPLGAVYSAPKRAENLKSPIAPINISFLTERNQAGFHIAQVLSIHLNNRRFLFRRKTKMKLAEALILRADCQKRVAQLKARLLTNAKVQEGDKPAETPRELLTEFGRVSTELLDLIKRINKTNSATVFSDRGTISDALAERDVLAVQRAAYAELAQAAAISQDRFTRSEVKYVSTINVAEIRKRADELAKNFRDLDARIQELNWQTELI